MFFTLIFVVIGIVDMSFVDFASNHLFKYLNIILLNLEINKNRLCKDKSCNIHFNL